LISLGGLNLSEHAELLETQGEGIFQPTATSAYLLRTAKDFIQVNDDVLDLGCGWGFVGLELALQKEIKMNFSDLSVNAVKATNNNSNHLGINHVTRHGSLFEPWIKSKFDLIICDVSGISTAVPFADKWFTGIPFDAGRDGTNLTRQVLAEAPQYLKKYGKIILPVISLSKKTRTLETMKLYFKHIDQVEVNAWTLEIEDKAQQDLLSDLESDELVSFNKHGNLYEFYTEIYCLSEPE
jgi:methylase of polypeptide subunit release factors